MFGILTVGIATLFHEIADSIGKRKVAERGESIYTMGFLNMLWGALFLFAIALIRGEFVFAAASLPTFGIRVLLEIAQIHAGLLAITRADRSTFSFLRILTIPLLLLIDVILGYEIGPFAVIGIALIVASFVFLFMNHGLRKKGAGWVLFSAVNAAATISLYKYDITHFNSVEAEQGIVMLILMTYLLGMALFVARENPLVFFRKPVFLAQSLSSGVGSVILSFAYLLAPASVITTAKRSFDVLWATVSGNVYFHEKKLFIKIASLSLVVVGLALLVF